MIDNVVVFELGDYAGMARKAVAATSWKLYSFLDNPLNNLNSCFFVPTNRYNPVDERMAIMENMFGASSVGFTIEKSD